MRRRPGFGPFCKAPLMRDVLLAQVTGLRLAGKQRVVDTIGRGDGRDQCDAIYRAGDDAKLAAGAVGCDHRVHPLRGADDGVGRAHGQAGSATDARGLVDQRDVFRRIGINVVSESNRVALQQAC